MRPRFRPVLVALSMLALASGPAGGAMLEPQVWGWEQFIRLDWTAIEHRGEVVLKGSLISDSPAGITAIRLLVESLDAAGAIQAQRLVWVPGDLTPFSRASFVAPVAGRAARYRVRVFTFDRIEAQTWGQ